MKTIGLTFPVKEEKPKQARTEVKAEQKPTEDKKSLKK